MSINFPSGTPAIIDEIINADGRDVEFFVTTSLSGCSDCGINPITQEPLNPFCTTCSGLYWIPTYSGYVKTCHVTWKDADDMQWSTGGKLYVGDAKVKMIYSQENYIIATTADYLLIDDHKMTINKITLLGVPSVNRILMHVEEEENTDE